MLRRDASWAVQQYEGVRALLPRAQMPKVSSEAANLGEISHHFDVFLLDAFGVLNVGNSAIAGAAERVKSLQDQGKQVLVLTNGATYPAEQALDKFTGLGFDFDIRNIVSSRDALAAALRVRTHTGYWGAMCRATSRVDTLAVPFQRLETDLSVYDDAAGFLLLAAGEWSESQQALLRHSLANHPRPVLVGNPDIVAPREDGLSLEPGHFAYELIRDLDVSARLFGKPFANIFDMAFERLGTVDPARVAMVGDTLHTDVLGGAGYGLKTVLVTDHGLFAGHDHRAFIADTKIVPDFIIPTI